MTARQYLESVETITDIDGDIIETVTLAEAYRAIAIAEYNTIESIMEDEHFPKNIITFFTLRKRLFNLKKKI